MNGATADPDVNTIRLPNTIRQKTIGKSQNFFRSLIKNHSSAKNSPMITSFVEWAVSIEQHTVS
jgi:hypothetical protein